MPLTLIANMPSGYNTNVSCGTSVYHVQTEYRPGALPQVETLVFLDGRIVGARRTPLTGSPDAPNADATALMEGQHRAVADEVRQGRFAPGARPAQHTIATIDDDQRQLDILSRLLAAAGHRSVPIADPHKALELLRAAQPDLVLCDILMSDFDGYAVLRQLQADPATAAIPVAFLTGVNTTDERHKAFRFGVVEYFTKPYRPSALVTRVAELIKERNQRQGGAVRAPALSLVASLAREARTGVLRYKGPKDAATAWLRAGELVDGKLPPATGNATEVEFTELDLDREEILPYAPALLAAAPARPADFGAIPPALRLAVLVHGNRALRKDLREALSAQGCRVLEAEDGEQGLALARRGRPSVVVSSTRLPSLGAFELRQALRASWETTHLPLLLLAGWENASPGNGPVTGDAPLRSLMHQILRAMVRYAYAWPPETGTISGLLESVGAFGLLRVCDLSGRSGRLIVGRNEQRIEVRYHEGTIIGADSGSASGLPALLELISWRNGVFLYVADEPPTQLAPAIPLADVIAAAAAQSSQDKPAPPPGT